VVSQSPRSTAATASMSSSETDCRPYGITGAPQIPEATISRIVSTVCHSSLLSDR
jgi:hypothetical protein